MESLWEKEIGEKTHSIATDIRFSDRQFARIRYGLYPEQMEDKWFVYYDDNRLHCYRSWTGMKVYEAEIKRSGNACSITEIITERDPDRYDSADDEDIRLFNYLFPRGLMRLSVEVPHDENDPEWSIKAWHNFGRMIL